MFTYASLEVVSISARTLEPLDALGDPTRRAVFELVVARPRSVAELAAELPVSRPAVSQHLRVLKEAGLVVDERDGARRCYRLERAGMERLRRYLDGLWGTALAAFHDAAVAAAEEGER